MKEDPHGALVNTLEAMGASLSSEGEPGGVITVQQTGAIGPQQDDEAYLRQLAELQHVSSSRHTPAADPRQHNGTRRHRTATAPLPALAPALQSLPILPDSVAEPSSIWAKTLGGSSAAGASTSE